MSDRKVRAGRRAYSPAPTRNWSGNERGEIMSPVGEGKELSHLMVNGVDVPLYERSVNRDTRNLEEMLPDMP